MNTKTYRFKDGVTVRDLRELGMPAEVEARLISGPFMGEFDDDGYFRSAIGYSLHADWVEEVTPDDELLRELAEALRKAGLVLSLRPQHVDPTTGLAMSPLMEEIRAALAKYDQRRTNP